MGFEYALVHLKFTIPPAIALTCLYRPLFARQDLYKLLFLITIAVVSTIPWDAYLIRRRIWTYPESVIVGQTVFGIPAEEVFFFVIQTYNTTLLYLLVNKPILPSCYLVGRKNRNAPTKFRYRRDAGQAILGAAIATGGVLVFNGGKGTYLGMILVWAGPFALLLWSLAYQFLIGLPYTSTVLPIAIPTLYLLIVDTLALKRGTWTIQAGTKLGLHVWEGLEIEEAIFFAATNILIVFGLVAFDNAMAVLLTFPRLFPEVPALPSPAMLVKALLKDTSEYDIDRIAGIEQAVKRLQAKSRSFYLASSTFTGRLRIDMTLLYSFCRVADDLVDNARTESEARVWIVKLNQYLRLASALKEDGRHLNQNGLRGFNEENFLKNSQSALTLLPIDNLSFEPLYKLLEGFRTDLAFLTGRSAGSPGIFPIDDEDDLVTYGSQVAGTVAELCLDLVLPHTTVGSRKFPKECFARHGSRMGIALQTVNIARDIEADAAIGRVYIPTAWLKEEDLTPQDVLDNPKHPSIERLRRRLLGKAFRMYEEAISSIDQLPVDARGPMRVAVESYMELGRVLGEEGYEVKCGRATVPKLRRIRVAWKAMSKG